MLVALLWIVALGLLGAKMHYGITAHPIVSGSMEPTMPTGSLALVRQVPVGELQEGDIISFRDGNHDIGVAHRIHKLTREGDKLTLVTKGDANRTVDANPYVVKTPQLGKVVYHIPYAGYASEFLKTREGFMLMAALAGLTALLWFWPSSRGTSVPQGEMRL